MKGWWLLPNRVINLFIFIYLFLFLNKRNAFYWIRINYFQLELSRCGNSLTSSTKSRLLFCFQELSIFYKSRAPGMVPITRPYNISSTLPGFSYLTLGKILSGNLSIIFFYIWKILPLLLTLDACKLYLLIVRY